MNKCPFGKKIKLDSYLTSFIIKHFQVDKMKGKKIRKYYRRIFNDLGIF